VAFEKPFGAITASSVWRLGLYSDTTGYPSVGTFHEDRLFLGGNAIAPQRLDGSRSGDYENFAPTDADGTITSSHALSFTLNSSDVNVIRWVTSDEKGLLVGTLGGEWTVKASSLNEALSPTNVAAKRTSTHGSANVQPVQVGKSAIFVQRFDRKVRDMRYYYDVDGFRAADLTELSNHIGESGIKQIAYQKEPFPVVWCVRNDGVLVGMTYEREFEVIKVGWHRHVLGGASDIAGTPAAVESISIIPSLDGTYSQMWAIVKRYVNGATKRYVEFFTSTFKEEQEIQDSFFVDSGLTLDSPIAITNITQANPAVVSAVTATINNGDKVLISEVKGMTEVNFKSYTVANKTAGTFELKDSNGNNVDSTGFSAYITGGEYRKKVTVIGGLSHLEGESVSVLADGAVHPNVEVTGGQITLNKSAAVVHVGYGYDSDGQMLRIEGGQSDGVALGRKRRVNEVRFLLHKSVGLQYGMSFDQMNEYTFRNSADPMSSNIPLFSGIIAAELNGDYNTENQICWRQNQPLPSTILAIMPAIGMYGD
jgi:hypothetical protein